MDNDELTRRDFVAMTVAAGLAAAASDELSAQQIVETNVAIKTPDGTCDAAFIHPATGAHPGVIIWPDAFGLRPSMRDMAKRLAMAGYSVLVPNPFYRVAKSPVYEDASKVDFAQERGKIGPLMQSIQADGAVEKDAAALIAWMDMQQSIDRSKKIGTQGYCMGGGLVVRTAATVPDRVGAGASFHGGGLVTTMPNSPHLLAPKIKARMYFGIATDDDMRQADAKTKLKEAFDAAKVPVEVEVYSMALHGWCVPDMPTGQQGPIYKKDDAERAWTKLMALYKASLV
jgi:carboxymethylenebutenolidase